MRIQRLLLYLILFLVLLLLSDNIFYQSGTIKIVNIVLSIIAIMVILRQLRRIRIAESITSSEQHALVQLSHSKVYSLSESEHKNTSEIKNILIQLNDKGLVKQTSRAFQWTITSSGKEVVRLSFLK